MQNESSSATGFESLHGRIYAEPKPLQWRTRSQVGDKVRWYEEPGGEQSGAE